MAGRPEWPERPEAPDIARRPEWPEWPARDARALPDGRSDARWFWGMWRACGGRGVGRRGFGPPPCSLVPRDAARAVKWLVEHSLIDTAAGSAVVCYSDPDLP